MISRNHGRHYGRPHMEGDEGLARLVELASRPAPRGRGGARRRRDQPQPIADDVTHDSDENAAVAPADGDNIGALIAMGAMRPPRQYEQRSWQLVEMARSKKKAKKDAATIAKKTQENAELVETCSEVAASFPMVKNYLISRTPPDRLRSQRNQPPHISD